MDGTDSSVPGGRERLFDDERRRWADVVTAEQVDDDLDVWRSRLLSVLLRVAGALGAIVAIPSMAFAFAEGLYAVVLFDAAALVAVALLIWAPWFSHRVRSLGVLAIFYGLGVVLFVFIGPVAGMYLMAVPVLAVVLIGTRSAVASLVVVGVTLFSLGFLLGPDDPFDDAATDDTAGWLLVTINFMFAAVVVTLSCAALISRLQGSLERARRLVIATEQSDNGVVIAELDGHVTYHNAAARELDLSSLTDVRQMLAGADPPPPDDLDGTWQGTVAVTGENKRIVVASTRPVVDRGARCVVMVLRDVTDERELEERLRRTEKLHALGTLVAGTAHDFNNALASVIGLAEQLGEQLDDPASRKLVDQILLASDRASDVVRNLMTFTRTGVAERHPVEVSGVLRDGLTLWRASVPTRLGVELDIAPEVEATRVVLDPPELHHVVANLVANAAHSMRERSSGVIRLTLERVSSEHPGHVQDGLLSAPEVLALTVTDDGDGIDPEILPNVFDPFFTTKGLDGSGLGLSSVHGIVSSLGGEISIDSTPGLGTAVSILLPASAVDVGQSVATPREDPAAAPDPDPLAGREVHAVIVDDEVAILDLVRRHLERRGVTVFPFEVATEAVDHLSDPAHRVDVVVTDLTMPAMSGIDLIRAFRTSRPGVPIIVMSGYVAGFLDDDRASLDVYEVLGKPFTGEALWSAFTRAIASTTPP